MKKVFFISLIISGVILTIYSCSKKKLTDSGAKEPDFAIEVSPKTQWVTAGESAEFQIKLTSLNGFSAPCTLSAVGFPGEDVTFYSTVLKPPDSTQLTIYTTFSTPRDTYQLTVTGKNENLIHESQALLVVPSEKVTEYYPLAIGNSWTYVLLDQIWDTLTYTIVDTFTINDNLAYILSRADTIYVYVRGDTIFSKSGEIILAGSLVVGRTWNAYYWNYEVMEFGATALANNDTIYENCLKIKKTNPNYPKDETFEWWAKDVGFVKMKESISGQYQGSMELISFSHD
ncbi:MAG: hypothetical protein ACE5KJ_03905 [Candidatus Zixiibacteriota bacterium]